MVVTLNLLVAGDKTFDIGVVVVVDIRHGDRLPVLRSWMLFGTQAAVNVSIDAGVNIWLS